MKNIAFIWVAPAIFLVFVAGYPSKAILESDGKRVKWDNDHQHPLKTDKKGPVQHGDYINPPKQGPIPDWNEIGQNSIQKAVQRARRMVELDHPAKNVIFFMGDGMGISTQTAARVYLAQSRGIVGEDAVLSWENFPNSAMSRTYATDLLTPDSANTATAMMCGEKTGETIICANQHVLQGNCSSLHGNHLKSTLHHAIDKGMWTGVVSNTRITHASPSVNYAHSAHRDWECDSDLPQDVTDCSDMASQLIDETLNQNIRVLFGGGRYNFLPNGTSDSEYPNDPESMGKRLDGRNLIQEWIDKKKAAGLQDHQYAFVQDLEQFNDIDDENVQYVMGLFEPSHMQYEVERTEEPSMQEMVEKSINILRRSQNGYFLFVESGRIDTSHHDNLAFKALNETAALSDAVSRAIELTSEEDTLIIVTADHSHTFSIAGYPSRDSDIFEWDEGYNYWGQSGDDGKLYATLQYSNGPGYYVHRTKNGTLNTEQPRINQTRDMMGGPDFMYDAGIPIYSETHTGEDVVIYASGPMAHLFHGVQEQNYVSHVINYALCIGDNDDLCYNPPPTIGNCNSSGRLQISQLIVLLTVVSTILCYF